jgi:hypothetical protein
MPVRNTMTVPARKCIFCPTDRKLTKEHIWPAWVRQEIPRDPRSPPRALHNAGSTSPEGLHRMNSSAKLARPGEMGDKKLRVVCGPCNNRWMSTLQEQAKPFLVPLIRDDWSQTLDRNAQRSIAVWATMLTMVLEYADPPTISIPQSDRNALRLTCAPPDGWIVFLGRNSQTPIKFYHQVLGIPADETIPAKGLTKFNTHITTFTTGSVLLQTTSSQVNYFEKMGFSKKAYCEYMSLEQIWPIEAETVGTPPRVYSDQDFVVHLQFLERSGFFGGSRSALRDAIDSGMFDPTYSGYRA